MPQPRPTFHAEIGQFLIYLRRMRGWSQRRAVSVARQRGFGLSLGALRFLEEGKTKHPDRRLLESVASLYDIPFELLVQRFVEANYGIGVKVVAAGESVHDAADPTMARMMDLEARVEQYRSTLGELRDIVDRAGVARERKGRS